MVAFLFLAPPLFLLAPLALLLAFSGPKTSREWIWILLAGGGSLKLVLDMGRADLPSRLIGTAGLLSAAAFVVVANLLPRLSTVVRGLIVVGVSATGLAAWILWYAIDLGPVDTAIADQIRRSVDLWLQGAAGDQVAAAKESAASVARLFPGMVALQALLGLGLSWRWYHRIASRPLPRHPTGSGRFGSTITSFGVLSLRSVWRWCRSANRPAGSPKIYWSSGSVSTGPAGSPWPGTRPGLGRCLASF